MATRLLDGDGWMARPNRATSIVNGGPVLVANGRLHVTPQRDGFVRPTNPTFYYGFSAERNPRTFAGVDGHGRTVIATADGMSTASLGLSITETHSGIRTRLRLAETDGVRPAAVGRSITWASRDRL